MRRPSAILLLLLFSLPLIWPAVLPTGSERTLPACCRGNGKHRCAMLRTPAGPVSGPTFQASRCGAFPSVAGFPTMPEGTPGIAAQRTFGIVRVQAAARPKTEALLRFGYSRCTRERGPPCLSV